MAKAEQVLILDPASELHFKGPFSEVTTTFLTLTNPTETRIAFKVKTTAPKTYCVRPNGGVIQPKETISVSVMLQPFDPDNDDRSRDKFMVQSMYIPDGEEYSDSAWHHAAPDSFMNSKLKCIFKPISEAAQVTSDAVDQPKTKGKVIIQDSKPVDTEKEKKLREEYKFLKAELIELRQENSCLKEEGIRSRMAYGTRTKGTSAKPESTRPHSQQASASKPLFSNYLIVISALIFLLGIYIGKMVL